MITHYGLFWSERDVWWGSPGQGNQGVLLGRVSTPLGRRGRPTDEERQEAEDFRSYVGLYCLYGDGDLIYIGQAGIGTKTNLFSRLATHRKGPMSGRWNRFSWLGRKKCEGTSDIETALKQLEAIAIEIINPGHNKQSGAFRGAEQVFQVPHEWADGDIETKLSLIAANIETLMNQGN